MIISHFNTRKKISSIIKPFILVALGISLILSTPSCTQKIGCKVNDQAQIGGKVGKNGKLSTKRGKSSLFPKNMTKKRRKRN